MADISTTEPRKLVYPLQFAEAVSSPVPDGESIPDTFSWQSSDPDEKIPVVITLSLNEYVALASAVDVGSDIAFGSDAIYIWWIWNRIISSMTFCDEVNDCIANNPSTITTINNTIQSGGIVNPDSIETTTPQMDNRLPPAERSENSSPAPPACDKDALWTGILEQVTRLDEIARDFWEDAVALNDKAERIAMIIDLVPIFGDIIADSLNLLAEVAPDVLNGYNAHSSQVVLEDTACALFEIVCQECRYPTYDEIYDHYASFGISGIQDIASYGVQAAADFLIGSNGLANAVVWYTSNAIALYTLYLGSTWVNRRGLKWLQIWADIGEDNPNNGWELLCDGCEDTNCIEYDFTVSNHGFTVWTTGNRPFGTWVNGVGWECTWNNVSGAGNDNRIYIEKINMPLSFDSADFEMDYISPSAGGNRGAAIRLTIGTSNQFSSNFQPEPYPLSAVTNQVATVHEDNGDGIRVNITTNTGSANPQAFILQKLRVYYTGANAPDGGSPC